MADAKNAQLTYQLAAFARTWGGTAFGSSGGFRLPDRSVLSPDGAWLAPGRWAALTPAERASFAPIVPDVWIELRSKTDPLAPLKEKLRRVRGFGAAYVALIDPYERATWEDGVAPRGLVLDLDAIDDC